MTKDFYRCPYCGFESDRCDFPDLFHDVRENDIIEMLEKYNINIVECGMCGKSIVEDKSQ